jgi:tripartite ATP-independent transporter DctP family solute receptor
MKLNISSVAGVVLASSIAVIAGTACAHEFRSADVQPRGYPTVTAVEWMGEQIAKETSGRYTIKVYPDGALGSEKDVMEQMKLGALEMSRFNISTFNNMLPESLALVMPFLFRDEEHMHHVIDGPIGQEILDSFETIGFVGLCYYENGVRSIYSKKAIHTPADVKGMKIRVQQSDLWVSLISAMGANATPMPTGEIFSALRVGIVDAAENNYATYESMRHFEVAPIFSLTEHAMAPEVVVFSKPAWDKLAPADQAIIRKAAKDSVAMNRKWWAERQDMAKAKVLAAGVTIVSDVDKPAFRALMQPVYDKFLTTPKLKDLAKRISETK